LRSGIGFEEHITSALPKQNKLRSDGGFNRAFALAMNQPNFTNYV
jgi:hypothetical protein